ncbi:prenyltransferase/squalene oxidase repeat-containing protein [Thermodesulfobacterium hydrogeniphilum]|uniref:prenyltransferase/squalene oxidase repeat-containing protein n=1 Tax=Thermodesulfobacterium hydrogeniphilum TaxID=161156 RepID=UPI00056EB1B9|nr:prenyltransferase/squalene oxidase repeat-containing protein [Thermodesulfobacterium hydrogeniphilum]
MKKEIIKNAIEFVLKREKEEGGFAGTPLLPPTIEDTYFAIKILNICNYPINIKKQKNFLLNQNILSLTLDPLAKFFKILNNLSLLNQLNKDCLKFCYKNLKYKIQKKQLSLKEIKDLTEIFTILKDKAILSFLKEKTLKELSKGYFRTIKDLYFLYKILQQDFPKDFFEFILEAQNSDGGFGFFKGTTSYMENTYYACYVLHCFNLYPKDLDKLKEFVLSCRNKDGGFGRNSQGISFLESTILCFMDSEKILIF